MEAIDNEQKGISENESAVALPIFKKYFQDERILKAVKAVKEKNGSIHLKGIIGSSFSLIVQAIAKHLSGIHIVVFPEKEEAAYFLNDLETWNESKILFFPSSFRKPFQINEPDTPSIQLRAETLDAVSKISNTIIVTYAEAIAENVISKSELEKNSIEIKLGEDISISFLSELLFEYGFIQSDYVFEPGSFSIRGGIIDIFSFANDHPYRIEFLGDTVHSIRTFDPATQLSVKNRESATILPNVQEKSLEGNSISFIDFLGAHPNIYIWLNNIAESKSLLEKFMETGPILNFQTAESLLNNCRKHSVLEIGNTSQLQNKLIINFGISAQPPFNKNFELIAARLNENSSKGFQNIIFSDSPKQIERLHAIFDSLFPKSPPVFSAIPFAIHQGFIDTTIQAACFTDHELFGKYHRYKLKNSLFNKNEAITIKMLKSLQPGDYITHIDYGIGRFAGLEKISVNGKEQEAICLVYKDNDTLHISIHALHQISKYGGKESEAPKLNKLGSNAWSSLKSKTKKKIKELAFDLVKLYAERKSKKGFAFSPDNYLQNELEASFIYEDTPDQLKSTKDVKHDMEQDFPMDRLVCGDVGFGKTEIAIRAAFKAALDGKQTAVLVPTTILALQHFKTFSERLKGLPCNVDYINRFKSPLEQKLSIKKLSEGKTDIIIGTHRLLSKDIVFKDLGLMIVDEEQKFGVGSKDKLKLFKANVDTLTLTATPIPRTLQFSMMGARDLSIINTPPPNRYPIITEIHPFNDKVIKDSIEYELQRGGQVFFVHNRVQNIGKYADSIRNLCPTAKILVAHGQLSGEALEKAMMDFIEGEYDVLVCTTIIESGLDISNANTIIINDAQNYGLSDLHQLRGRVGRSNKKSFCYLLTPPFSNLTNDAKKRLHAIEEFSELGSGFNISMRDLDIRGAGNLLGAEQSGFITDIGYEMYQKILDEALTELKTEMNSDSEEKNSISQEGSLTTSNPVFVHDCHIETDLSILIPNDYVENIAERISLYQQLDNSKSENELLIFEKQLIDRFGEIPEPTKKLINIVRLRWQAIQLGFEKLIFKNGKLNGYFVSNKNSPFYESKVFTKIVSHIQNNPKICTITEKENKLILKIEYVKEINDAILILSKLNNES